MTRQRMFLEISCVDAARARLRHVYDTFDTVVVQFSGGKDSLAVLLLAKELHEERGLGPVNVIHRDEEMSSPSVVKFVEEVRQYPWVNMEWYCLPSGQEIWVLCRREYVLLWSAQRKAEGRLVREMPPWAIRAENFGLDPSKPCPRLVDYYTCQGKRGKVAFVTGVRANESMVRYRSCVQKLNENYVVTPFMLPKSIPMKFAKIIYDWTTEDVMKFIIHEHNAEYCEFYDLAELTGSNPRVGIPLHSVAIRRIGDVIATEPEFYDDLVRCFPQIDAQRRYWANFDIESLIASYSQNGWDGVRDCIDDHMLTPGIHGDAMRFASAFRKKRAVDPYGFPLEYLIRTLLLNEFHQSTPTPVGPKTRAHAMRMKAIEQGEDY